MKKEDRTYQFFKIQEDILPTDGDIVIKFGNETKKYTKEGGTVVIPAYYIGDIRPQVYGIMEIKENCLIARSYIEGTRIIHAIPKGTKIMIGRGMYCNGSENKSLTRKISKKTLYKYLDKKKLSLQAHGDLGNHQIVRLPFHIREDSWELDDVIVEKNSDVALGEIKKMFGIKLVIKYGGYTWFLK